MDDRDRELETIDRRLKVALLVVSLLTIAALAVAAVRENVTAEWRVLRARYGEILEEKATDDRGRAAARQFGMEIVQSFVPQLDAVDRCQSCHAGVEDPRMADQPLPFRTHPGRHLEFHDPEKFGCTVCHQGQGRATEAADAHGRVAHWDFPMLPPQYATSACSTCHAEEDLFGGDGLIARSGGSVTAAGGALLEAGARLVTESGCLGCHRLDGKGGSLSHDITFVAHKTAHQFDFSHLDRHGPRDVSRWLYEHFLDPVRVSPGTSMPRVAGEREAAALTAYMLSLRHEAAPYVYRPAGGGPADERSGRDLYRRYCSACHGTDGRGSRVQSIPAPGLNNADALAVASDDFYRLIIENGRSNSGMPAWGPGRGGLSRAEIDRIVTHIRSWQGEGARVADVNAASGDPTRGRAYYRGMCAGCHGGSGEGGIGNALNSPTFLAVADDDFLARAIIDGRPGTAMPAWRQLSLEAVNDLVALIRSWQPAPAPFAEVTAAMAAAAPATNARIGRALYQGNCAACHGRSGEGGIAPSLTSPDFLGAIDDRYLHRAITEGRPGTAMPAWRQLSAADVGALIAYLRSVQRGPRLEIAAEVPPGDYAVGEVYYRQSCAGCHGEQGIGGLGPQLANPVFLASVSDGVLFRWIAWGRSGTAMQGFLPEAQGVTALGPEKIRDVIAYLRHLGQRDDLPVLRTGVGNAKVGAELFQSNCASCHGPEGEGSSGPQLANPAFLAAASDGFLLATITLGRAGTPMPPMAHAFEGMGQLSPQDVQDIIAYMRRWEFPASWKTARRIAEMSPRAIGSGRALYASHCKSCHGPEGLGPTAATGDTAGGAEVPAPALNNPEFLEAASDGFLLATIARGRDGTAMRPFGEGAGGMVALKGEEISDLVAYIRSWQEPGQAGIGAAAEAGTDDSTGVRQSQRRADAAQ
jgi:mono/diheme cytochrome c family protein